MFYLFNVVGIIQSVSGSLFLWEWVEWGSCMGFFVLCRPKPFIYMYVGRVGGAREFDWIILTKTCLVRLWKLKI